MTLNPFLARFDGLPVMVNPEMQGRFTSALNAIMSGEHADQVMITAYAAGDEFWTELGEYGSKRLRPYIVRDGVLLIPVKGVLLKDFPYQYFDLATGYEYIRATFDRGLADSNVKAITFVYDTPGGMVAGNFDLADHIYNSRGTKPIAGFADEHAYSAGYSLISTADPGRVHVARTGGVGSIGVVTAHVDVSKMMDKAGFQITFIYAGAHKVDGNPYEALKPEVKERIQNRINQLYGDFVSIVARNRGMDEQAVRDTEALTFSAAEAISNGLADKTGTLEEAVVALATGLSINEEDENMADFSQAQYDEGTAAARSEGLSAGRAEGSSAMRSRIEAIVASDEGKKRPTMAMKMAVGEKFAAIDAETIIGMLADLPEEKAETPAQTSQAVDPNASKGKGGAAADFAAAMSASDNPNLAGGGGGDDEKPSRAAAAIARVKGPAAKKD